MSADFSFEFACFVFVRGLVGSVVRAGARGRLRALQQRAVSIPFSGATVSLLVGWLRVWLDVWLAVGLVG